MTWLFLSVAIIAEVSATLGLKLAIDNNRLYAAVIAGYAVAFEFLSAALNAGMGIGVAYGVWTAAGVALTALLSRLIFHEPLTRTMLAGIALIMIGVMCVELGIQR